ncbi:unnamed protein product [Protopolystoma xenopodis]|uniref:Uncharacterized protein n=1 Tax=Protopolystoma xenopodis TaxID=117903 RepID=A0A3S5BBV2_9PLAT|nr:unnamed protein product [Protopolystoma xenopodis]
MKENVLITLSPKSALRHHLPPIQVSGCAGMLVHTCTQPLDEISMPAIREISDNDNKSRAFYFNLWHKRMNHNIEIKFHKCEFKPLTELSVAAYATESYIKRQEVQSERDSESPSARLSGGGQTQTWVAMGSIKCLTFF